MALSRYRTGSLGSYVRTSQRGKSGGIYAGHDNHFYGHRKILKPEHLDWQEYALLLLNSMPEKQLSITAIKSPFICTGIRKRHRGSTNPARGHWRERYPLLAADMQVLLNNDYWCRALSFSPTKAKNYQRYNERIKGKRQEWGYYATTINAGFNAISRQLAGR